MIDFFYEFCINQMGSESYKTREIASIVCKQLAYRDTRPFMRTRIDPEIAIRCKRIVNEIRCSLENQVHDYSQPILENGQYKTKIDFIREKLNLGKNYFYIQKSITN